MDFFRVKIVEADVIFKDYPRNHLGPPCVLLLCLPVKQVGQVPVI